MATINRDCWCDKNRFIRRTAISFLAIAQSQRVAIFSFWHCFIVVEPRRIGAAGLMMKFPDNEEDAHTYHPQLFRKRKNCRANAKLNVVESFFDPSGWNFISNVPTGDARDDRSAFSIKIDGIWSITGKMSPSRDVTTVIQKSPSAIPTKSNWSSLIN